MWGWHMQDGAKTKKKKDDEINIFFGKGRRDKPE